MNDSTKPRIWRSIEERDGRLAGVPDPNEERPPAAMEMATSDTVDTSRRTFLKLTGFGVATTALAGCSRGPVQKAIPYLIQPEEIVPGKSYWMASTCGGCTAGCGVLVKCRDGRPIKLEGNPQHPVNRGGLCAVAQASVLALYDSQRLRQPMLHGENVTWPKLDGDVLSRLQSVRANQGTVRVLTGTVTSGSTRRSIEKFLSRFADGKHVEYDGLSQSAILDAHQLTHGHRILPRFRFDRANMIVSFDADFLGTWISPVEFTAGYAEGRQAGAADRPLSQHVHYEGRMSLTGSRADRRMAVAPWEMESLLAELCRRLAEPRGQTPPFGATAVSDHLGREAKRLADELGRHPGKCLVVCGVNSIRLQCLTNYANHLLDGYGSTLELAFASRQKNGRDRELFALRDELQAGAVDVLVVSGVNPAYDLPAALDMPAAITKAGFVVYGTDRGDETSTVSHAVFPEPHFLERWDDAEPIQGVHTFSQPTITPSRERRTLRECLSRWSGAADDDRNLVMEFIRQELFSRQSAETSFERFCHQRLHDGFLAPDAAASLSFEFDVSALRPPKEGAPPAEPQLALVLYPKVGMLDGRHAHNPWLQELPDPVSKIVWDNYASFSPRAADRWGLRAGDVVELATEAGESIRLPVNVQPGQHDQVVAVALGYGRLGTDRFTKVGPRWWEAKSTVEPGETVGANAAVLLQRGEYSLHYDTAHVSWVKTGRVSSLACTQDHHSLRVPEHLAPRGGEVRDAVMVTTPDDVAAQRPVAHAVEHATELWPEDHEYPGHHWGMAIDLNRCTGCSACVIGCQAENNIPVVGRDEVGRHREMQWLRIDRYWESRDHGGDENVTAHHQPMMCQQCDNAPCENVCPVLATVHSSEGLNQQVYNRCVGTRYCANNCPYKTRRFNWFDYPREDRLQNMALNPDVTVRTRGVMEKCTFCVQRIQEGKIAARAEGRALADGEIQPACQQSCPASAITFGDLNDPDSKVNRMGNGPRGYAVLAELNVKPSIQYLAVVRNGESQDDHL